MKFGTLLTLTVALSGTAMTPALSQAATLKPGTLTIGSDLTYPPYNFLDQGKAAGFDAEFMALLAANLHLKPQVQDTRFASLILGVNTSKIDVIASTMYVTPERAQQVNFIPYMKTGGSLLVDKSDAFRPRVPEDLCGKSVSSIKGAAWIARFAKVSETVCKSKGLGPILVREFPSSPEATQALLSHAVNAQFEDAAVAKAAAGKSAGRLLISSHSMIYPVVVGLALPKSNPGLQTALNNAFEAIKKNGKYAVLLKKYNVQLPTGADIKNALASDH